MKEELNLNHLKIRNRGIRNMANENDFQMKASQLLIFNEIAAEREKQDKKWGQQNHHPIEWCGILGEEVGEVNKACIETHFGHVVDHYAEYRKELIQTAGVAVSMIECLDRKNS